MAASSETTNVAFSTRFLNGDNDWLPKRKKATRKPPSRTRETHFLHDARGDSTIIARQARISSDASPQPVTCLTHAIAEAFVAGLVASKEETAASSSISSSRNSRSSAAAPPSGWRTTRGSSAFARS